MRTRPTRPPAVREEQVGWAGHQSQAAGSQWFSYSRKRFPGKHFGCYENIKLSCHYNVFHLFVGSFPQPNTRKATGSKTSGKGSPTVLEAGLLVGCPDSLCSASVRQHLPWGRLGPPGSSRRVEEERESEQQERRMKTESGAQS